jgi:hypothetical protein
VSIKIMAEVWDNAPSTGGELLFLLALADQAGDFDRCAWPGMKQLMSRTRSSRRSVYRYAEALQAKQIIVQVDAAEARKKIPRYRGQGHGGHETVIWRILSIEEWGSLWISGETSQVVEWGANLTPHVDDAAQDAKERVDEPWGARKSRSEVSPAALEPSTTTTTNKKKTSTASQQSPSSRRAARARDEGQAGWDDPAAAVFAKQQVDDDGDRPDKPKRTQGPDSAWSLNGYYREQVFLAGKGRVGNTNDGAMRRFFAEAKRAGVPADTLRGMVDAFVADDRLFNKTRTSRWRVFIANASTLQQWAEQSAETATDRTGEDEISGVPQHILDAILAEAG